MNGESAVYESGAAMRVEPPGDCDSRAAHVVDALLQLAESVRRRELGLIVGMSSKRAESQSSRASSYDHWFV